MKLYLHAGTQKTGTTSIQNVLRLYQPWLSRQGLYYPQGRFPWGTGPRRPHHMFCHALSDYSPKDVVRAWLLLKEMEFHAERGKTIIFSCELLYRHKTGDRGNAITDQFWTLREAYLRRVRRWLSSFEITPVLYFRNRADYAASYHNQMRVGGTWTGDDLLEFMHAFAPLFDYDRQIDLFRQVFGTVQVRSYDDAKNRLIADFFDAVGFPMPPDADTAPRLRQRASGRDAVREGFI